MKFVRELLAPALRKCPSRVCVTVACLTLPLNRCFADAVVDHSAVLCD